MKYLNPGSSHKLYQIRFTCSQWGALSAYRALSQNSKFLLPYHLFFAESSLLRSYLSFECERIWSSSWIYHNQIISKTNDTQPWVRMKMSRYPMFPTDTKMQAGSSGSLEVTRGALSPTHPFARLRHPKPLPNWSYRIRQEEVFKSSRLDIFSS